MPSPAPSIEHLGCHFASRVRGDGEPVLFIQGTGCQGDAWAPQIDALAARYRCLSFDNRGMAGSQPVGAGAISVPQLCEDTRVVMDAHGFASAHVVGHSLGGLVALELALAAPGRVRSLSLLNTFARGKDATRLSPFMLWVGTRTRVGTRRARRLAFLRLVSPPGWPAREQRDAVAARLALLFGHDLADSPPIVMKQLAALRAWDVTARLGELAKVPTLVVSAFHDPIARVDSGRRIAAGIPGARYVEIADASHALPVQQPERVNALLVEHIDAAVARPA